MKIILKIFVFLTVVNFVVTHQSFASSPTSGTNGKVQWKQISTFKLPYIPVDSAYSLDGNYAFFLTENNAVLIYDGSGNLQGSVPVGAGVSAIKTDPRGQLLYLLDDKEMVATTLSIDLVVNINTSGSPFKGESEAPVTIAVFSDFQ